MKLKNMKTFEEKTSELNISDVISSKNYIIHYSKDPSKTKLVNKRLSSVIELSSENFVELVSKLNNILSDDELKSISKIYID